MVPLVSSLFGAEWNLRTAQIEVVLPALLARLEVSMPSVRRVDYSVALNDGSNVNGKGSSHLTMSKGWVGNLLMLQVPTRSRS